MISIQRLIEQERNNGYLGDNASAKVCQDIVLKALASSSMSRSDKKWIDDDVNEVTAGLVELAERI